MNNGIKDAGYADLNMTLTNDNTARMYWTAQAVLNPNVTNFTLPAKKIPYGQSSLEYVQVIAFVDRVFPSFLSSLVQNG